MEITHKFETKNINLPFNFLELKEFCLKAFDLDKRLIKKIRIYKDNKEICSELDFEDNIFEEYPPLSFIIDENKENEDENENTNTNEILLGVANLLDKKLNPIREQLTFIQKKMINLENKLEKIEDIVNKEKEKEKK